MEMIRGYMDIKDLIEKFSDTAENKCKAMFSTLFIVQNRLQTTFDNTIPELSLKQFMLLTMVRQTDEHLTFTQLGHLLGCSRQNIKKLALALEKKGFVTISPCQKDARTSSIYPTDKLHTYFDKVFFAYQQDLKYLFEIYTTEEIEQLFRLLMKLYEGVENLELKIEKKER